MNMPVVAAVPVPSVRSTWLYGGVIVGAVDVSQAAVIDVSTKRAATALSENHEPARITTPRERVAGNIDYLTGSAEPVEMAAPGRGFPPGSPHYQEVQPSALRGEAETHNS